MRRVGFFGGTFDPPHFGHLSLAVSLLEQEKLDQILFSPCFLSPFKVKTPPVASWKDRCEMVQLAIDPYPPFSLFAAEKEGISYTVDALSLLDAPDIKLFLLLSDDQAASFFQWKEPEKILSLASLLIGRRAEKNSLDPRLLPCVRKTPLFEVSSSEVRGRLAQKKMCHHLLPSPVLDYIQSHRLYL